MSLIQSQKKVIPNRIKYLTPNITDYVSRQTTKIIPNNAGSYLENAQITIELPASGFADFQTSYLSLNVKLTSSTADTTFDDSSCSFIKRVRIADGYGNTLEDITNYNELSAVVETLTATNAFTSGVGQILDGTSTKYATTAGGASAYIPAGAKRVLLAKNGCKRNLKLVSGILQSTQLFPLQYTKGLIIEINLSTSAEAGGIASATAPILTVSNVAFVLDTVQVSPEYNAVFKQTWETQGIKFWCPTYLSTINTTSGSNYTTTLSENMKSLKHVWFFFRDSSENNDATKRQTEIFEGKSLKTYQFRHGVRYNPQQKVDCEGTRAEAMAELLKSINVAGDVTLDLPFTLANYSDDANYGANGSSTKAIFGQNFEVDAQENMSGIDSNKQPLSIELEFASSTSTNLYTLVAYDQIIIITPQGCLVSY